MSASDRIAASWSIRRLVPPEGDICRAANCSLLDHLVGEQLHRIGNREAQGLRSLEIDHEFELGRPLHRQVSWLLPPDNPPRIDAGLAIRIRKVGSVAHKPARDSKIT